MSRSGNTFTVSYYYQTQFNVSDNQTLNRTGGAIGGAVGFNNSGGGPTLINTATFTGTPGGTYTFSANITGIYNGGNPSVSGSYTIPLSPPAAPSAPTITRVSDTQHTVTWTRNSTGPAPYQSQKVQRREYTAGAWGAWATVADVSGSATSWTDTRTVAGRVYTWRVQARNSSGSATGAQSIDIRTTPPLPADVVAAKSGADIVITWGGGPSYGTGWETQVEASQNGGAYSLLATVAGPTRTYTHVAPLSSVTWTYRVRHRTTTAVTGLLTGYATSNTVQLLTAPAAPTNLAPTTTRDPAGAIALAWQHNPLDTTPQTQLQVRHRAQGSPTWTTAAVVTSAVSTWTLPAGTYAAGQVIEWQVTTRGAAAGFSPWSASALIPTSSTPTVAITTPVDAAVIGTSALTVAWAYDQSQGSPQASWRVELLDAGAQIVETHSGQGPTAQVALRTVLPDASSWTVRVSVTSAAGLASAPDTAAITVSYQRPPAPTVTIEWVPETASATVDVTVPAPGGGQVAAVAVDVLRSTDGEATWVSVASEVQLTAGAASVTDPSPRAGSPTSYRAEAVSALPSRETSAVVVVDPAGTPVARPPQVWLSDPEADGLAWTGGDVTVDHGVSLDKVLHRFAGRALPVQVVDPDPVTTWQVAFTIIQAADGTMIAGSPPQSWQALAASPRPLLLRSLRDDIRAWVSVEFSALRAAPVAGHRARRLTGSLTCTLTDPPDGQG